MQEIQTVFVNFFLDVKQFSKWNLKIRITYQLVLSSYLYDVSVQVSNEQNGTYFRLAFSIIILSAWPSLYFWWRCDSEWSEIASLETFMTVVC